MKQYITMKKIDGSRSYKTLEPMDYRFGSIIRLFDPFMIKGLLLDWLYNEKETSFTDEWISIQKERNLIVLYDVSDRMSEEYIAMTSDPDPAKCFKMTFKNFAELLETWEELRVSRPDTILVVIHEDNHVSLEIDPVIIKEYQDAGYAFDITKTKGYIHRNLYVVMKKIKQTCYYQPEQAIDYRFGLLIEMLSPAVKPGELSQWFSGWLQEDNKVFKIKDSIEIRQEDYYVSLYDAAYQYADDNHHDPESMKHFQIPYHDFINFLTALDEIQKNRPEKCLLIIHKHGGISLQADPIVMKRYFDDGNPFDSDLDAEIV